MSHSTLVNLKTSSPNKSHSWVLGVRASAYEFGGERDPIQLIALCISVPGMDPKSRSERLLGLEWTSDTLSYSSLSR